MQIADSVGGQGPRLGGASTFPQRLPGQMLLPPTQAAQLAPPVRPACTPAAPGAGPLPLGDNLQTEPSALPQTVHACASARQARASNSCKGGWEREL